MFIMALLMWLLVAGEECLDLYPRIMNTINSNHTMADTMSQRHKEIMLSRTHTCRHVGCKIYTYA